MILCFPFFMIQVITDKSLLQFSLKMLTIMLIHGDAKELFI
ncbi:hypothetical protein PU02_0353 [Bartonella ancashensis]|uniref:Uncharacterized protein n=1 Tax=Bartonella ancashensis TaxID=1318743 RepID=A0A0M4M576_9HYPH|nr:hypothetical protein PU02_0353 [Bartonella ancashensis]